jgi:hypothetical protein
MTSDAHPFKAHGFSSLERAKHHAASDAAQTPCSDERSLAWKAS